MSKQPRGFTRYTKEKYLLAFLLGFGCFMICALPIMISNRGYYIYSGDYNSQQIPFYNMANDTVRSGQFGWNWYTDLGSDFMTSYSFYLTGSPFFWLSVILPRGLVTLAMPVLLALKHGIASVTAYAYIRRFVKEKNSALIGGLLYACSGFQAFNVFFNHFQDVTAFFPLMLIAMEENINKGRKGVFAVTVAFMAVMNYYFFAGQAVFLILYYLFRMKAPDFDTSWKKFFLLCFEAVVGTMVAAFILLPSAMAVITNQRVDERAYGVDMVIYTDKTLIPRIIQSFFMQPDPPACPNLFVSDYEKWASIGGYFPLFSMAGVAAFMRGRKKHWATGLSIACIIAAFVPVLNSLFQAANSYYYARWFYMPILIFAMMTAVSLDDEQSDLDFGWKLCAFAVGAFALIGCLPVKKNDKLKFFRLPDDIAYFWLTIGLAVVFLIVSKILFSLKKKNRPFLEPAVWLTAFACAGCFFTTMIYSAASIKSARYYTDAAIRSKDVVYEEVSDDNFFRIDISEDDDNYGMLWKLPNMRAFQSVVNTSIMDFYHSLDITRDVASRADMSHYTLRGLFSVKYFYRDLEKVSTYEELINDPEISEKERSKPGTREYYNAVVPDELPGFEYIGTNGDFEYYENTLYIPMGFAYDQYITEDSAKKKSSSDREKLLIKALVLDDEQAEKYSDIIAPYSGDRDLTKSDYIKACKEKQKQASSSFSFDSHGFESEIELDKPSLVFFSVPYSEGWTAEVNGKTADVEKVSYGFMAVKAEAGENNIVFRYKTPGLAEGSYISLAGLILLAIYLLLCRLFRNKKASGGHRHYYDYNSTHKVSASQEYIRSLTRKER